MANRLFTSALALAASAMAFSAPASAQLLGGSGGLGGNLGGTLGNPTGPIGGTLGTAGEIGYMITDLGTDLPEEDLAALRGMEDTIRLRVLTRMPVPRVSDDGAPCRNSSPHPPNCS